MLETLLNFPSLVALNLLALVNAFTGGTFDQFFEEMEPRSIR
ncbi:hypothetical protein GGQ74_002799 [Desulfobaculum xiamenense]|uniref:Uncharacterized protein n=1 Tax=Desulfobaculum xiamenense TaxID=995050 RepID=A0A846QUC4_9BACT|nr:hypothetical protein [Desulfobaculum xiamenense]NJB69105.1 hypothetical protein [Desulfobaculum xiamenense]